MNPVESWLSKLETRLQNLVEGTAARLLPGGKDASSGQTELDSLEQTSPLQVEPGIAHLMLPPGAFLVVDGVRVFALDRAMISIGRAPENDLVIADPRVSREHVQLRAINGRYVVFDLDSTGGTSLNGLPIRQHPLVPGDVITLAGVPLVYGEDSQAGADHTQELAL
jgi:hypothetical protein